MPEPSPNQDKDTELILKFMLCAYVAPEMLIEEAILPGSQAKEAYRRIESAVLGDHKFYDWFT